MDGHEAAQREITAFWNTVGPRYDSPENVATAGTDDYTRWREVLRGLLPAAPAAVLDVGTGTGFVAGLAAELGHQVTAIDLSSAMLAASTLRDTQGITFSVGDAVDPPFPAESFDAIISRSLLWTLRAPEHAFESWSRLLRPGGRVVAIYGLTRAETPSPAGPYTAQTRAQLPAMHLAEHRFLLRAATAAGLREVSTVPLESLRGWETSPGSDLPYALIGYRPPDS